MNSNSTALTLADAQATERAGLRLAQALRQAAAGGHRVLVTLDGPLGAGKTSLAGGIVRGLGHQGVVKSPTYTLVEPYDTRPAVFHMDLYRLEAPEAFADLGVDDERGLWLVEWPQRARGALPPCDLEVVLDYADTGRQMRMQAVSPVGSRVLSAFTPGLEGAAS